MMRTAVLAATLVSLVPALVRADLAPPEPFQRSGPAVTLISVDWRAGGDAPEVDREMVTDSVREQLYSQQTRIERCLGRADLREDPMRARVRRITVVMRFSRSARPRVSSEGSTMPPDVRACILESARSVQSGTTPRGTVTVRAVYELR